LPKFVIERVGTMFRIFSIIIETIKDPLLRRLIRPSAQEFRRPSLRHRALPTRPPSGVGASWPAISTTSPRRAARKYRAPGLIRHLTSHRHHH